MPVYEQFGSLDGNGTNQLTRPCFSSHIALVLSHHPRNQCGIDVIPHRVHRCWTEAPIIIQPTSKDRVEFTSYVLQTYVRAFAQVQLPNLLPHSFEGGRTDPRVKARKQLSFTISRCPWAEAVSEKIILRIRILVSTIPVFAVDDSGLIRMHLQLAFR